MQGKCPTCGRTIQIQQFRIPAWARTARVRFGETVQVGYCPHCQSEDLSHLKPYYQDFIAGKVDINGNPRPMVNPLPTKIRSMTFASFQVLPELEEAYYAAVEYTKQYPKSAEGGRGLLFYGPVGTGKTHLAAAICNELISRGFDVMWANTPQFITRLKRSFDTGVNEATIMEAHIRAGLLVLDDIGSEKPTEWVESRLYEVINSRIEREAPIIFTSNCQAATLTERLGQRVVSRIRGISRALQLNTHDFRARTR